MNRIPVLIILIAAAPAFAADAVLSKVMGPVFVRAAGSAKDVVAEGGEELIYGDTVKTGAGALAHVMIGDDDAVLVRENSVFTLQGEPEKILLNFKIGEFLIGLRKKLEKGQSFRVRTPSAVAAVRGTLFWGKTDTAKTTTFAGFGHAIAVTAKGKTVIVNAGQTTTVALAAAPADPSVHAIPVSYLDGFQVEDSLSGLGDLVDLPQRPQEK